MKAQLLRNQNKDVQDISTFGLYFHVVLQNPKPSLAQFIKRLKRQIRQSPSYVQNFSEHVKAGANGSLFLRESCEFFIAKEVDCSLATTTRLENIERDEKYQVFSDSDLEYESNDHEAPDSSPSSSATFECL
ncbi:uncharacterized protein LOC121049527 [Rosa chinensis]|uniref:uncharacterized protein LOC121049527 n=1 Tax=Rosa chinensis TaxID=74649 RepID=UPI001AD8EC7A|nr:uncharacterized protein LOC121049527 [Rosa chinensis]